MPFLISKVHSNLRTLCEIQEILHPTRLDVYVFGPRANGTARRLSDLDLLIKSPINKIQLSELEEKFEQCHYQISQQKFGVSKERIMQKLGALLMDVGYWIQNKTFWEDEIAARFHQRFVLIHIFPNGNGRHARLITNLLLKNLGEPPFTWGSAANPTPLEVESRARKIYVAELRKTDGGDYQPLLDLVRS